VDLTVDLRSGVPPYEQIRAQIAGFVGSGLLAPGTRLPTIRALAADLGVAAGTVARAYTELESAGVVTSRRRTGTVVSDRGSAPVDAGVRDAAAELAARARAGGLSEETVVALVRAALGSTGGWESRKP
jgi:GntR family transcriptional regulator